MFIGDIVIGIFTQNDRENLSIFSELENRFSVKIVLEYVINVRYRVISTITSLIFKINYYTQNCRDRMNYLNEKINLPKRVFLF